MQIDIETDIRAAGPADLGVTARNLAAAFQDDPIFAWCVPDARRRRRILPAFFELVGRNLGGGAGQIDLTDAGAAMWAPPGIPAVTDDAAAAFEAGMVELFGEDAGRTFELIAVMEEHHPHDEHAYLWFLGVEPQRQGRGIGSRLLRHGLDLADRTARPAYLEATSEDNVRLYVRHGFEIVRELRAAGSPPLTAMWRPAAS
jgi:ribosomal protein S18 acetylase RimI-like enzyme